MNTDNKEAMMKDYILSKIEAITGTLASIEWHKVSIEDMKKLLQALEGDK